MSATGFSRRALLLGSSVLALSATATNPVVQAVGKKVVPMWAVGTSDDWNWLPISAPDAETARRYWVSEQIGGIACDIPDEEKDGEPCDCEWCEMFASADVERKPSWDGKAIEIGDADWMADGLGAHCSRCSRECFCDDRVVSVAGKPVCGNCLTPTERSA